MPYNELCHYGILGVKWGVRRTPAELGRKKLQKEAKRDAKRYADAKMYYGKGAGNRRKLLDAELSKKKKDPEYSKMFDEELSKVDMARSAKKAKAERTTRDVAYRTKVNTGKILRVAGPIAVTVAGIYYARNKDKVDSFVNSKINSVASAYKNYKTRRPVNDMFRRSGLQFEYDRFCVKAWLEYFYQQ